MPIAGAPAANNRGAVAGTRIDAFAARRIKLKVARVATFEPAYVAIQGSIGQDFQAGSRREEHHAAS